MLITEDAREDDTPVTPVPLPSCRLSLSQPQALSSPQALAGRGSQMITASGCTTRFALTGITLPTTLPLTYQGSSQERRGQLGALPLVTLTSQFTTIER
eukprot:1342747-Amphidinium_carterae.3